VVGGDLDCNEGWALSREVYIHTKKSKGGGPEIKASVRVRESRLLRRAVVASALESRCLERKKTLGHDLSVGSFSTWGKEWEGNALFALGKIGPRGSSGKGGGKIGKQVYFGGEGAMACRCGGSVC